MYIYNIPAQRPGLKTFERATANEQTVTRGTRRKQDARGYLPVFCIRPTIQNENRVL